MMLESNPINPIISSHYPNLIMYDNNPIYKFHSKDIIIYILLYYYSILRYDYRTMGIFGIDQSGIT